MLNNLLEHLLGPSRSAENLDRSSLISIWKDVTHALISLGYVTELHEELKATSRTSHVYQSYKESCRELALPDQSQSNANYRENDRLTGKFGSEGDEDTSADDSEVDEDIHDDLYVPSYIIDEAADLSLLRRNGQYTEQAETLSLESISSTPFSRARMPPPPLMLPSSDTEQNHLLSPVEDMVWEHHLSQRSKNHGDCLRGRYISLFWFDYFDKTYPNLKTGFNSHYSDLAKNMRGWATTDPTPPDPESIVPKLRYLVKAGRRYDMLVKAFGEGILLTLPSSIGKTTLEDKLPLDKNDFDRWSASLHGSSWQKLAQSSEVQNLGRDIRNFLLVKCLKGEFAPSKKRGNNSSDVVVISTTEQVNRPCSDNTLQCLAGTTGLATPPSMSRRASSSRPELVVDEPDIQGHDIADTDPSGRQETTEAELGEEDTSGNIRVLFGECS
ncbi:hypothetical protein BJ875DRAFT_488485 [Amylocarpus encephaloides]|uniref:Uncharacterized protein n=1 Tax=Amylocarpus encephaloides TaxID=45428 RepID=A0A9P8C138_9HELO|nr:hypothetical protein BJ875DRAFT_488485 [Amylocarpus encephaloides]